MVAGASTTGPDHQLVFVDTSGDIIAKTDVLAARKLLSDQNIDPTECFIGIGPEKEAEILNISDFITASVYGVGAPLASGQIGSIYGSRVILHTGFADRMVMWHPASVGFAYAYGAKVESARDLPNLSTRHSISLSWCCKVLDSGKRLVHVDSTN